MASRSPNYPNIALKTALDHTRKLWAEEKRSQFPGLVAVRHMGFGSLNGTSRGHLAGVKHYGLLKEVGESTFALTPLAIEIMAHPADSLEARAAIQKAALTPKLFREIRDKYPEASSDTIKAYLITQREFGDDAAKKAIKNYRDAMEFAQFDSGDYTAANDDVEPEDKPAMDANKDAALRRRTEIGRVLNSTLRAQLDVLGVPTSPGQKLFPFYLSKEQQATLYVPESMTQKEYKLLKQQIENSLAIMEATILADDEPSEN